MARTLYTIRDQDGIQVAQTADATAVNELREPHHTVTAVSVA